MAFMLRNRLRTSFLTSVILGSSLAMATTTTAIALPPAEVPEEAIREAETEPASPKNAAEETAQEEEAEEATQEAKEKETEQEATQEADTDSVTEPVTSTSEEPDPQEPAEKDSTIAPVAFPEAGITLIPPANFEPADLYDGFQEGNSQSSIIVFSFPAPVEEMLQAFSDKDILSQKGMTLISQETVSISDKPGLLIQLEQEAHGLTFSKWVLIFGEDNKTTLINASFPKQFAEELSAPIKASLLSTQIDDSLVAPNPEAVSGFSITPTDGMDLALEISGTLLYSEDGELNGEDPTAPLFIVSPSFSDVLALDPGQFSRDRLQQTEQVDAIEILSQAPITINDLEGYEITATAQDLNTGTPLLVYQTILFAEDRYYIMQGLVVEAGGGPYLADFKAMAESFQRK